MVANKDMSKRYHLNRPDLAQAVAVELRNCQDVKSQQRLLAASDPEAEHVVIWDQAGFHPQSELHALPERVHLVPLPPDSPELNPVEAIGDLIKDRIGNQHRNQFADLEQAIGEELRELCENTEAVRRLVSHPWLIEQANATATTNSANYIDIYTYCGQHGG
jgi:hypothetical protein